MKVLVFTPQYAPDYGPSAPIYTALCEDLQQMGCDVTVITAFPNYTCDGENSPHAGKLIEEENRNGVRVIRTYIYSVPKKNLWRRLIYHGSFNLFATLASLRIRRPDVLLADAPTLWSGLPLMVKAILPRVPYIYIVHDIYPDVLFKLGMLRNQRILDFIARVEDFYYRHSAHVSVLSEGFKENLLRKGVAEDKITIIPACVDSDFIQPLAQENKFRQAWQLSGKFVVLYAGNIGFSQGLDYAVRAAQALLDCPELVFVFVGEGSTCAELEALAQELKLSNVRFIPFQPREDVPLIYAAADISLVSLKRDIVVESVPSKTYTIMASGRPLLATVDRESEVGRLIEQSGCGLCVEPENAEALALAIRQLYNHAALRSQMGTCGRDYVVTHYARGVASRQYYSLIRQFVPEGP